MGEGQPQFPELSKGELVAHKWLIDRRLGAGGCGVVYTVQHLEKPEKAALKLEWAYQNQSSEEVLKMEVHVLRKLAEIKSEHAARFIAAGKNDQYNYLIMQLLGPNLGQLKRDTPEQKFTLSTVIRLSLHCFDGLWDLHKIGFVHRDVKPSNFAIGLEQQGRQVYILDFGLARSYLKKAKNGKYEVRQARTSNVAFRGTARYCSVNVHRHMEQGRHDDFWSLLYMTIELINGQLPWQNKSVDEAYEAKCSISIKDLFAGCPPRLKEFMRQIQHLTYYDEPDYPLLRGLLKDEMTEHSVNWSEPYDWQEGGRFYDFYAQVKQKQQESGQSSAHMCDDEYTRSDNGAHAYERDYDSSVHELPQDPKPTKTAIPSKKKKDDRPKESRGNKKSKSKDK